ncbi:MAG: response regulator transcription factor [Flavobacteriales bacterium]|jgi:DNA-binding NarL/FixJ family response regulator|nr:response regulator transcription factor [Flavobacteriales bacterium]
MSKLFIVDDHQMMIDGIVSFLKQEPHIEIVGVANSYEEALRKIVNGNLSVDIVLTDLNLQGKTGVDLISMLKSHFSTIKYIVFTMYFERSLIKELMSLKVEGFVEKNAPQETLKQAINDVSNGNTHYPNNLMERIKNYTTTYNESSIKDAFASRYKLSKRELEIALLVIDGMNTEQIAQQLQLSPATISTHRKNLNNKTNTSTPLELYKLLQ